MNIQQLKQEYFKHKKEIKEKLSEFSELNKEDYIYELFFCILTPQSKAEKCWDAVLKLKERGLKENDVQLCLKTRTRFYRNKTGYLIEADKKWDNINKLINSNESPREIRELLVKQVKGLGMKEASHFLRNIGKSENQLAILDRHVLRKLMKLKIINEEIKLNNKNYLLIEKKMKKFADNIGIPLDELDLLFWKIESGRIFK